MFESTGLRGHSQVREISMEDGSLIRSLDLNDSFFGEGMTLIDDRILVLTWKAGLIQGCEIPSTRARITISKERGGECALLRTG